MINYYQTYVRDARDGQPRGIFVVRANDPADAMFWNKVQKAWIFDPQSIAAFRFKAENIDRYDRISRAEAEALMLEITKGTEALPDEETILWIFQWKGAPPQDDD